MTDPDQDPEDAPEEETEYVKNATGALAWMAKNPVAANLIMLLLLVGGAIMLKAIRQEVFPGFELDLVLVNVGYPGASPDEVEQGVVLAIEESIRGLDGIKEIRSTASEGVAVVAVELVEGTETDRALADIKASVDRITSFPEDIERPVVSLAAIHRGVIDLVLYGDQPEASLRALAEQARSDLLADPNITYVELGGIRPREISIEIPQSQLREYGLTLEGVAQTIRASSVELPAGGIKTNAGEILLRTDERREMGQEFGDIVLRSLPDGTQLRVQDVAQIHDGFQDNDQVYTFDGKPAVSVKVYRVGDETPIAVADAVEKYAKDLEERLPDTVQIAATNDRSKMYRARIDLLMRNARTGLILVLLILGLFLELRLAFWVTMGIPISFIGSLLFMPSLDVSINMISLFAFIVTLGMVVDDAIVVGEAIHKHLEEGRTRMEAAIRGVREVARPVVFSILTTCIAFAPMLFVPGTMGKFFMVIPIIVILVLLMSLLESLVILPAHLGHKNKVLRAILWVLIPGLFLFDKRIVRALRRHQDRFGKAVERFIQGVYQPALSWCVRNRYITMAAALAALLGSCGVWAGKRIEFTFMPKIEGNWVVAEIILPYGSPAHETRAIADHLTNEANALLDELGGRDNVSLGVQMETGNASNPINGGSSGSGSHTATVFVSLVETEFRDFSAGEFTTQWRKRAGELPGVESLNFHYGTGASAEKPIAIELSHPNMEVLESAALALAEHLREYAGVIDIDDGFSDGKPQLDFSLRPEGRSLGITEIELARQVRSSFFGAEAGRQQRGRDEVRTYVRLPKEERESLYYVENLMLRTPQGGEILLNQAADVKEGRSYTAIKRTDGRRTVNITADVTPGVANANEVVGKVMKSFIPTLTSTYPGINASLGGEQKTQKTTIESLQRGALLAILAMFALLAIAFRSYSQPAIILSAIPFGFIGALIGHLTMGYGLSLMSLMGLVALSGVVINDSLIFIDAINTYRAEGLSVFDSILTGGARRFRPILLTSLTTFFGLVPIIFETSMQARFLIPMAISLGFGVMFATVTTLLLIPSTYAILEDAKRLFSRASGTTPEHGPLPGPAE